MVVYSALTAPRSTRQVFLISMMMMMISIMLIGRRLHQKAYCRFVKHDDDKHHTYDDDDDDAADHCAFGPEHITGF